MLVSQEIADFVQEIDDNYTRARLNRVSRMDVTWGKWSRDLNLRMRARQNESTDPNKSLLVWCFMYWMNRSQLLELYFKHRLTRERAKRDLAAEGEQMRKTIMSGDPIGPPEGESQIRTLLAQVGKEFNKKDDKVN